MIYLGTNVSGQKGVGTNVCGHSRMGPIMYEHKRGGTEGKKLPTTKFVHSTIAKKIEEKNNERKLYKKYKENCRKFKEY